MVGALLDTHALYWLITAANTMSQEALLAIAESQTSRRLYVSPISAWELSLASLKPPHKDPPDLGKHSPAIWFARATRSTGAKLSPIYQTIACEAAMVVVETGHKDPGDCYLIATARVKGIPLITRDATMQKLAADGHVNVLNC